VRPETPAVQEFLLARGAGQLAHPGGTLHAHLNRVAALLAEWGADEDLQVAGLCHASYGTDGFGQALLTLDERPVLRALAGARVESLVYGASLRQLVAGAAPWLTDAARQAWSRLPVTQGG
jgi:(p)ppGpp synthase/HD superfamily hydrolase